MRAASRGLARASSRKRSVYTPIRQYAVGQTVTGHSLQLRDTSGAQKSVDELFGKKRVVIVGIPGAFTPVCTSKHVPEFVAQGDKVKQQGVDEIAFVMVNDPFVVKAYEEKMQAPGIKFYADYDGSFTKYMNMGVDLSAAGLGQRCKRYTAIIDNGKIVSENVEAAPNDFKVTNVQSVLDQLSKSREQTRTK
eukprot:TRINITY_DN12496_c0_g1_i1.p1 TRINITY_DN12496_c0_g1~~TRINITY_DN12496_c0_g1_i1.p1  ORF type:complete len:200 (-),score=57.04 TRINITY_DN12496_c0_g1_i1:44-619(-)